MFRFVFIFVGLSFHVCPAFGQSGRLNFNEFMTAFSERDLSINSSRDSETIWLGFQLDSILGWDRTASLEWTRSDFDQGRNMVDAAAELRQSTPVGISGTVQYKKRDPLGQSPIASFGVELDILRNNLGRMTHREEELLDARRDILRIKSLEAGLRSCFEGLSHLSDYMLLNHQSQIFDNMLEGRQDLLAFVRRRVAQGALSRADQLSVEVETAALKRDADAVRQAYMKWLVTIETLLDQRFSGIDLPQDRKFQEFGFIAEPNAPWLPEVGVSQKKLAEAEAQKRLIEENSKSSLRVFGQRVVGLDSAVSSHHEYGLSLTVPFNDFKTRRELAEVTLASQELGLAKLLAEQKASIFLAEAEARKAAINKRLGEAKKTLQTYKELDVLLVGQYKKGAIGLERVLRQQELRLREELTHEQALFELRAVKNSYLLMGQVRPKFCEGA
jgi:hypothetical protein